MEVKEILSKCDHTLLSRTATWLDIKEILDDGIKYGVASACIPPCFVARAKEYVGDKLKICTVIGFPNGYNSTESKRVETLLAVGDGADEIDVVMNVNDLKSGDTVRVLDDLKAVRGACKGKILKVIIETCLLTESEKITASKLVTESGADFIKTSTGFSTGGATADDVRLLRKNVGKNVKVKAAGGISSISDAEEMIKAGADRLGTSRIVKIVKGGEVK
ncbi:MAG: deoxyribose-phosphate aldolase [Clostridia bacterium]|nr:deoxyribose-phosphate aldolase [Clostridia bacterium]